jgi:hypothetical protein
MGKEPGKIFPSDLSSRIPCSSPWHLEGGLEMVTCPCLCNSVRRRRKTVLFMLDRSTNWCGKRRTGLGEGEWLILTCSILLAGITIKQELPEFLLHAFLLPHNELRKLTMCTCTVEIDVKQSPSKLKNKSDCTIDTRGALMSCHHNFVVMLWIWSVHTKTHNEV